VTVCSICKGMKYTVSDGKRVKCVCLISARAASYLKPLGEIKSPGKKVLEEIKRLKQRGDLYLIYNEKNLAKIAGIFAYLLLKRGGFLSYRVLNVYEIVEIFLGKYEDIDSVFKLKEEVLILTNGFREMENVRQEDLVLQTLENRKRLGKSTWFFSRGFKNPLATVDSYMKENDFEVLNLNGSSKFFRL